MLIFGGVDHQQFLHIFPSFGVQLFEGELPYGSGSDYRPFTESCAFTDSDVELVDLGAEYKPSQNGKYPPGNGYISHLVNRKIIDSKLALTGDMLVSKRVVFQHFSGPNS